MVQILAFKNKIKNDEGCDLMKNIEIKVSRETRMVFLEKNIIGNDGENLQEKLVFSFKDEFVNGQARLEYEIDGEKYFAILTKVGESYEIPIKNVITKEFQINMQLVITEGTNDNEIPVFKSNVFYVFVNKSINAESEEPDGYTQWLDIANTKLNTIDEAINYANEQGEYANKQGNYAKEQGTNAKKVADDTQKKADEGLFNGKSLEFIWDGTKLGIRLEGESEYRFVNLQGVQGIKGDTGEPFKIKKTYPSVAQMKLDFSNMEFGDYVMIASSVEVEDNAKLYTRGEFEWIYITDFSGAMGIRGETGLTPNIQIGNVQTLEPEQQATVTRSGTNENPIFNFAIPMGKKGDNYEVTNEDLEKIATNITENANSKFNQNVDSQIENFNKIVDEGIEDYNKNANDLITAVDILTPKQNTSGVPIYVDDALPYKVFNYGAKGNFKQETTTGKNKLDFDTLFGNANFITKNSDGSYSVTGNGSGANLNQEVSIESDNYYLSLDYESNQDLKFSGDGNLIAFNVFYEDGTTEWLPLIMTSDVSGGRLSNKIKNTTQKIVRLNFTVFSRFTSGTIKFKNVQIGIDDTYEPFTNGASPNPNYSQKAEVIEGDISYFDVGQQLYDYKDVVTVTSGITRDDNGWITVSYDNTSGTEVKFFNFWTNNLNLKPSKNYLIVAEIKNVSGTGILQCVSKNFTNPQTQGQFNDQFQKNFTELQNGNIVTNVMTTVENIKDVIYGLRSYIAFKVGEKGSITFRISVVDNLSITPNTFAYKPYQEILVPIDLKGNFVGELPNGVADRLLYKDRHIYLEKNVGKVVLDGSDDERWTYYSANDEWARPYVLINDKKIAQSLYDYDTLSNKFISSNWMSCYLGNFNKYAVFSYNADKRICFLIKKEDLISLDTAGIKDYFSKNQTETYYPLESPELIDLGEYDLSTLEGVNNISLLANIEPSEMNITYALDIKKYIDKKVQ